MSPCIYTFTHNSQSEMMKLAVDLFGETIKILSSLRNTAREVAAQVFIFDLGMESLFEELSGHMHIVCLL